MNFMKAVWDCFINYIDVIAVIIGVIVAVYEVRESRRLALLEKRLEFYFLLDDIKNQVEYISTRLGSLNSTKYILFMLCGISIFEDMDLSDEAVASINYRKRYIYCTKLKRLQEMSCTCNTVWKGKVSKSCIKYMTDSLMLYYCICEKALEAQVTYNEKGAVDTVVLDELKEMLKDLYSSPVKDMLTVSLYETAQKLKIVDVMSGRGVK